jgi:catechol 2,3-dioxygenase-like lactoylglutathione lyase family enzyme
MEIVSIHHVSLAVRDLPRAIEFYRDILELEQIERPPFDFPGAWFAVGGGQQLHLIADESATFRGKKPLNTRDGHFAVRVRSYRRAVEHLLAKGYRTDLDPLDPLSLRLQARATAGFPQIYILDPDWNVIEINAESAD